MNNVLIVGANGLIGSNLVRHFDNKKESQTKIFTADTHGDVDLIVSPSSCEKYMNFMTKHRISKVINLAAISSEQRCLDSPELVQWQNVEFPCVLFGELKGVSKETLFVHASTEWIYGDKALVTDSLPASKLDSSGLGLYASSKLFSERRLCDLASSANRLAILRLGIVYSLSDNGCNSFVNKAFEAASNGEYFVCKSGNSARRYVSMSQVCSAFERSVSAKFDGSISIENVQGPELLKNGDVLEKIKLVKPDFRFEVETSSVNSSVRDILNTFSDHSVDSENFQLDGQLKAAIRL